MGRDPIFDLYEEDRNLRVGASVVACWTAGGFTYRARAEVVTLTPTELTVRLLEDVADGRYRASRLVTLPRMTDVGRWSSENCVRPVPVPALF